MQSITGGAQQDAVQPWRDNPRFWQYKGEPVLLLGGTVKDNLFQIPDLEQHLDLLLANGGNYIRNTMSDRPDQGFEVKAFGRTEDGLYDLERWNPEYWSRFEHMLQATSDRGIVVQIEMWDRFDHSQGNWDLDPYNPKNNVNYSHETSGLAADYPDHPGQNKQPLFYTVPKLQNNKVVLPYQRAFVDQVLARTLRYSNVLYCIDNETSGDPAWSTYWLQHIRAAAASAGVEVFVTEMWDHWDVRHETHRPTFDHLERYDFVDISQNSHNPGQLNWQRAQWVRTYLAPQPRPMNSTKIYGADTSKWTQRGVTSEHAEQTFWRNMIGGFASSRFHRPPSGLGLGELAQAHLRSARMLQQVFDPLRAEPDAEHTALQDRAENEAYAARTAAGHWAVYFPDGGQVGLMLTATEPAVGGPQVRVLDIRASRWLEIDKVSVSTDGSVPLACPPGPHVFVVTP